MRSAFYEAFSITVMLPCSSWAVRNPVLKRGFSPWYAMSFNDSPANLSKLLKVLWVVLRTVNRDSRTRLQQTQRHDHVPGLLLYVFMPSISRNYNLSRFLLQLFTLLYTASTVFPFSRFSHTTRAADH